MAGLVHVRRYFGRALLDRGSGFKRRHEEARHVLNDAGRRNENAFAYETRELLIAMRATADGPTFRNDAMPGRDLTLVFRQRRKQQLHERSGLAKFFREPVERRDPSGWNGSQKRQQISLPRNAGETTVDHLALTDLDFSRLATFFDTKGEGSPPIDTTARTRLAAIWRTAGEAAT
jgi:hypothetical protein